MKKLLLALVLASLVGATCPAYSLPVHGGKTTEVFLWICPECNTPRSVYGTQGTTVTATCPMCGYSESVYLTHPEN